MSNGIRIGNERTGYKVPFVFALAIIAAIIVAEDANPRLPRKIVIRKTAADLMIKAGNTTRYKTVTADESISVKPQLNINFPK
jgi:hypothetical protein